MTCRPTVLAFALAVLPTVAPAADIVLTPPAAGGVTITNAAGNATHLRVADDGTVTLPKITPVPGSATGLCREIDTGKVGTCSVGTITSVVAGTGLTGGTITTSGTLGIASGGVGTAQLADLSVTTAKLADGAVTAAKLASSGCTTDQILKYNGTAWVCAADANSGAPLPTVLVASLTACCTYIPPSTEASATQVMIKGAPTSQGKFLARLDAQLNTLGALYYDYHCKLQALQYPYIVIVGAPVPWVDLPGTRRDVSWRMGKDGTGNGGSTAGASISMQAPVTAGFSGVDVRMVCWGTWDGASPPIVDYGYGVESAVLTLMPVAGFN